MKKDVFAILEEIIEINDFLSEEIENENADPNEIVEKLERGAELMEELDSAEGLDSDLSEGLKDVAKSVGKEVWGYLWHMNRAAYKQQKLEKQKLNMQTIRLAADEAPNKEERDKINAKATRMKEEISTLQQELDDRYKDKGMAVQWAMRMIKHQGMYNRLQNETGMSSSIVNHDDLKDRMKRLADKMKEEKAALDQLKPSAEDTKRVEDELKAQKIQRDLDIKKAEQKVRDNIEKTKAQEPNDAVVDKATESFQFESASVSDKFRKLMENKNI